MTNAPKHRPAIHRAAWRGVSLNIVHRCDRETKSKEWQKQEAACAQKDLFR